MKTGKFILLGPVGLWIHVDKNTDMTKNAGMEEFYDKMGAITPEEASKPLADFVEKLDMSMSGKFWAPRKFSSG